MSEALDCGNDHVTSINAAKIWLNYDGDANTITDSFRIASVTDNGTGDYDVNFSITMANTTYVVQVSGGDTTAGTVPEGGKFQGGVYDVQTTFCSVSMVNDGNSTTTATDGNPAYVVIYGDE